MRTALTLLLSACLVSLNGGCAMAADLELRWEWPADRKPDQRIAATVKSLAPAREGVKKSPSLVAQLPDPMQLEGSITVGPEGWAGRSFALRVPKLELADLKPGDSVALGLVGNDTCICIAPMPAGQDAARAQQWLQDWNCTP